MELVEFEFLWMKQSRRHIHYTAESEWRWFFIFSDFSLRFFFCSSTDKLHTFWAGRGETSGSMANFHGWISRIWQTEVAYRDLWHSLRLSLDCSSHFPFYNPARCRFRMSKFSWSKNQIYVQDQACKLCCFFCQFFLFRSMTRILGGYNHVWNSFERGISYAN